MRAERDPEQCHLVEPARDDRGARVVAEAHAFRRAGGDRVHVFQRACDFDTHHVERAIATKSAVRERALTCARDLVIIARDHDRKSAARAPLSSAKDGPDRYAVLP